MQIDVLGPLRVVVDGEGVEIAAAKERALVEILALRAGQPVGVDALIDVLWGDSPPESARKTLQSYVSQVRKTLGAEALVTEPPGYALDVPGEAVDADRFETLVTEGRAALRAGEVERSFEMLSEALALWRGPPLVDLPAGEVADAEVTRLEELRLRAVEDLSEARLALGQHEEFVPELESLVAEHPYREVLWSHLMVALYRCGRQRDALRAFQRARERFAEELGIEPGAELRDLERMVLDQDPALDVTEATSPAQSAPSALPSGTVTFLFTDIEGSTRRWQDDPSMPSALARHDEIVREAVENHCGHLLKHTGDGVVAVFPAAAEAAQAAVEAQSGLVDEQWEDSALKARMALHSGEAEERDGDYFGPSLNVAARLMGVAHGGQVLMSLSTEELVRDRLPGGFSVLDLGEHRLPDIDRPQRVFQLCGDGLESAFPPLTTGITVPTNLPEPRTSFVGRERDLARIVELFDDHRLVSLIGVGGAGKTRLAIEVGRALIAGSSDRFTHGVFFADLSSVTGGAGVTREVAEALGMPPMRASSGNSFRDSLEDRVLGFLGARRVLLLLDNCEHLLDECADLVDRLLVRAPGLCVLVTSREALAVEGEQLWQVRSLALPDQEGNDGAAAMQLLLDRIRAVRPEFEVGPDSREHLVEICRRLDGIPLALELAAARADHLGPAELARRLGDRFKLLAGGRRRAQRRQTLQATIDWSHDLLEPGEEVFFRRLAVFSGGFDLDAAEGICTESIEDPAIDLLGSLVAKSLVLVDTVDGHTRYRLLETIRLYAEEKLAQAGEAEHLRSEHRDWWLDRLEHEPWDRCITSDQLAAELHRDFDNVRAALEWCEVQGRPDLLRRLLLRIPCTISRYGRFEEAQRWFDESLDYEREVLPQEEWLGHVVDGWMETFRTDARNPSASETRRQRLGPVRSALSEDGPASVLMQILDAVALAVDPGRADEFERRADRAVQMARGRFPLLEVHALWLKAVALLYQRRYDDAAALLEDVRQSSTWDTEAESNYVEHTLALVHHLEGRHHHAIDLLERGESEWANWMFNNGITLAAARAAAGAPNARTPVRAAVAASRESGWVHPLAHSDCLVGFAALAALEGDTERASRLAAAVPGMATSTPMLWVLLRHYRDLVRDQLTPEARHRCIEEGRAMSIDEAIDRELARWDLSEEVPREAPSD